MNSSNNDVIVMWYCIRVALGDLLPSGFTGPTKLSNGDNYEVSECEWDGKGGECEWDGEGCECEWDGEGCECEWDGEGCECTDVVHDMCASGVCACMCACRMPNSVNVPFT